MMLTVLAQLLREIAPVYIGYVQTQALSPYFVVRDRSASAMERALTGGGVSYEATADVYCCAETMEASRNLALLALRATDGRLTAGGVLEVSAEYGGEPATGLYEHHLTVRVVAGGLPDE